MSRDNEQTAGSKIESPDLIAERLEQERRARILRNIILASLPILGLYTFFHLGQGHVADVVVNSITATVALLSLVLLRRKARSLLLSRLVIASLMLLFIFLVSNPGAHYGRILWTYLFPMLVYFLCGLKEGTIWLAIFIPVALFMMFFGLTATKYEHGFTLRYAFSVSLLVFLASNFEAVRYRIQKRLVRKQHQLIVSESGLRRAFKELQETQAQLIQSGKLASIGELASGIAHELNQPLMVIRSTAQLLARQLNRGAIPPATLEKQLDGINRHTKRMMMIIRHLKAFSRQSTPESVLVDVNRVFDDALLLVGEQMRLSNIKVEKKVAPALPLVSGRPYQLEQVFLNLLTNARDAIKAKVEASPSGKGTDNRIDITIKPNGGPGESLMIVVSDTGSGIAPDDMPNIFDPFFTTKEVGKGTGLGLSISYRIIEEHAGELRVGETGARGTQFIIHLPATNTKKLFVEKNQ